MELASAGGAGANVELPCQADLLDPHTMLAVFTRTGSGDAASVRIAGRWYQPQSRCTVSYLVTSNDNIENLYVARAVPSARPVLDEHGTPSLLARCFTLWRFPYDEKLPGLRNLAQSWHALCQVAGWEEAAFGFPFQILKYTPAKRCVLRIERTEATNDREGEKPAVAKVFPDSRGHATFGVLSKLRTNRLVSDPCFQIVEPIGYDPTHKVLWQQWCEGESFGNFADQHGLNTACELSAHALADLHSRNIHPLPTLSYATVAEKLNARMAELGGVDVEIADLLAAFASRIRDLRWSSPVRRLVPSHGDFNPAQILFHGRCPVLLDFDAACQADPHYDLAHFVAGLWRLQLRNHDSATAIAQAVQCFLDAYRDRARCDIDHTQLRTLVAIVLIYRNAYKILRHLEERGLPKIRTFLRLAYEYLH